MKKNLLSVCLLLSVAVTAQTFSNGPLITGTVSTNGTTAPAGYSWSELQSPNTGYGFSSYTNTTAQFRLADDFTVPANEKWSLSSVDFFVYQTGATSFPFDRLNSVIYDANPATGGTAIYGDNSTNVLNLSGSGDANIYRITTTPNTQRKIWRLRANSAAELNPGTYWIDFQVHATNDGSAFTPPVTILGVPSPPDANAVQNSTTGWISLLDTGSTLPQAVPFIITYTVTSLGTTETRQMDSRVKVYPNPVTDVFRVSIPAESLSARTVLSLYDQSGRKVQSFTPAESYNIKNLEPGLYLLKIDDGQNIKATKLLKK